MRLPDLRGPLLLAVVLAVSAGCASLTSSSSTDTTAVTSASMATSSPPLALFVLRIADEQLPLDATTRRAVLALESDAEAASRPLVGARDRLTDTLVRLVNDGRVDEEAITRGRDDVVHAAEVAAPALGSSIERLHALLPSGARAILRERVATSFGGWSRQWAPRPPPEPAWLAAFAEPTLGADAIGKDLVATARVWAEGRSHATEVVLQNGPLTSAQRLTLIDQLRAGVALY